MKRAGLVVEYHYRDGDVGSHPASAADHRLWTSFARGRDPSHVVLREDTDAGQRTSNWLFAGDAMRRITGVVPELSGLTPMDVLVFLGIGFVGYARSENSSVKRLINAGLLERRDGAWFRSDRGYEIADRIVDQMVQLDQPGSSAPHHPGIPALTERLESLMLMAANIAGSLEPEAFLAVIEEQLTVPECDTVRDFLVWLKAHGLVFGHGDIQDRFDQFRCTNTIQARR